MCPIFLRDPRISGGGLSAQHSHLDQVWNEVMAGRPAQVTHPTRQQLGITLQGLELLIEGRFEFAIQQARSDGQQEPFIRNLENQRTHTRNILRSLVSSIQEDRAHSTGEALNLLPSGEREFFERAFAPIFERETIQGQRLACLELVYRLIHLEGRPVLNHDDAESYAYALLEIVREWSRNDAHQLSQMSGPAQDFLLQQADQMGSPQVQDRIIEFREARPYFNTVREILNRLHTREGLITVGLLVVSGGTGGIAAGVAEAAGWSRYGIAAARVGTMWATQNTLELGGTSIARALESRRSLTSHQVAERLAHSSVSLLSGEVLGAPVSESALAHFFMFNHGMVLGPELASRTPGLRQFVQGDNRPYLAQYLGASVDGAFMLGASHVVQAGLRGAIQIARVPERVPVRIEQTNPVETPEEGRTLNPTPLSALGVLSAGLAAFLRPETAHATRMSSPGEGIPPESLLPFIIGALIGFVFRTGTRWLQNDILANRLIELGRNSSNDLQDPYRALENPSQALERTWKNFLQSRSELQHEALDRYDETVNTLREQDVLFVEYFRLERFFAQPNSCSPEISHRLLSIYIRIKSSLPNHPLWRLHQLLESIQARQHTGFFMLSMMVGFHLAASQDWGTLYQRWAATSLSLFAGLDGKNIARFYFLKIVNPILNRLGSSNQSPPLPYYAAEQSSELQTRPPEELSGVRVDPSEATPPPQVEEVERGEGAQAPAPARRRGER